MKTLFISLLLSLGSFAQAADPQHCHALPSVIPDSPAEYCVYPGTTSDVLFYLHGLNGSAETWMDDAYYTGVLRAFWKDNDRPTPTVVSLSFGPKWLLTRKNHALLGQLGLLDYVQAQWLPAIEKELGGIKGRKLLMGESMGGINSIQLALHSSYFDKVAALCAPMTNGEVTPFDSDEAMATYIRSTLAWKYFGKDGESVLFDTAQKVKQIVSLFYADKAEFADGDPVTLASTRNAPLPKALYLSAGAYDQYLAFEGNARFAKVLKDRGASVEWHPQWGGHCVMDIPSIADFLAR